MVDCSKDLMLLVNLLMQTLMSRFDDDATFRDSLSVLKSQRRRLTINNRRTLASNIVIIYIDACCRDCNDNNLVNWVDILARNNQKNFLNNLNYRCRRRCCRWWIIFRPARVLYLDGCPPSHLIFGLGWEDIEFESAHRSSRGSRKKCNNQMIEKPLGGRDGFDD